MIIISGFNDLLKKCNELPDVGWLYVEESFDLESREDIMSAKYYIAEDEDEEISFDENYGTFLECPIFKSIIENKLAHHPESSKEDFFKATVHYIENDDYLD